ncbi:MAG: response regulator [Gammaproteobacteria bacterium]|jgi:DNA-binding response OmpR family regulator|nr:response regulator [Gammaproteobacteria bacterium]
MNILLVEDDKLLADGIISAMKREHFSVNHVVDGTEALTHLKTVPPDILILDLGLPGMDGMDVLKRMRKQGLSTPVIILTARDMLDEKIAGLNSGADDYITKPFELKELIARIRVLERRISNSALNEIVIGEVSLDTMSSQVMVKQKSSQLSRREYMLLKALMENAGSILTKSNLESKLYDWGEEIASNAIEVHIHNLRKKLPDAYIHTVHGMGYIIKKQ